MLHIEGFTLVDPQSPLGGPDGRKDIICEKRGIKVVGASYFPPTNQDFKSVKEKFLHDHEGVAKNNASGFAFFVNQPVTPTERTELAKCVAIEIIEIYHLERIASLLDSPRGYGLRLEYLRVAMNEEEQLAFWSSFNSSMNDRMATFENGVADLKDKLDMVLKRTLAMHQDLISTPSSTGRGFGSVSSFPTEQLSIPLVMWIHKLVARSDNYKIPRAGELRGVQIWIGPAGSTPSTATFLPPPPEDVYDLLDELLFDWRKGYIRLGTLRFEDRLEAIASFHHRFLAIHPFLDANGRVARYILEQQILELLGKRIADDFISDPSNYYDFLSSADNGNLLPLINLLRASLETG
jgi:fido (protein-threonine AMPylation protein)